MMKLLVKNWLDGRYTFTCGNNDYTFEFKDAKDRYIIEEYLKKEEK